MYEDDDTDCVIKEGSNSLGAAASAVASLYQIYTAGMKEDWGAAWVAAQKLWNALKVLFGGDYDFVGIALGQQGYPITGNARKVWPRPVPS